ncbi:MAG: MFS transporter [Chloroflexota bacterium]|nr:MFS transporter [Chloroflexota bacterium]MDE2885163.1 MFS transporter [Chloroflexota bacterium]
MRLFGGLVEFFAALRYRDFRLFWMGLVAQITGQQMTIVTLGWLAFDLTESPLALGFINLVAAAPRILVGLAGGVFADRFDPRTLVTAAQATSVIMLVTLAALTLTDRAAVWNLAAAAFVIGLVQSFDEPARMSLFPRLLPDRSLIPIAVPLTSVAWSSTRIIAPSIAGFVIAAAGAGPSFLVAAAGAAAMAAVMRMVHAHQATSGRHGTMLGDLKAGAAYVWGHPVFRPLLLLAFAASAFGQGYMLTLPVFQAQVHEVGPRELGYMYSSAGAGALAGLYAYSRYFRKRSPGHVVLGGAGAFGTMLVVFAITPWFEAALVLLFIAASVGVLQITTGQVILQTLVDDSLRGRVMALYGIQWGVLPVGGALMNGVAQGTGAPIAVAGAGALLLAIAAVIAARGPALRAVTLPQAGPSPAWA